jgi:hypothetical protein
MASNRKPRIFTNTGPDSQTMFYVEGNPTAVLVSRTGRNETTTHPRHASPEKALGWCRSHRAQFVYLPVNVGGN